MGQDTHTATTSPDSEASTRAMDTGQPAGGAASEIDLLRFELLRSALYHDISQHRLGRVHRLLTFATILLGSSAVAGFGTGYPVAGQVAGALIAIIGSASLVWGFGETAVLHADLRRRYYGLLSDLERGADFTDLKARMTAIYADEPPVSDRINRRAHDQAGQSLFGDNFVRA